MKRLKLLELWYDRTMNSALPPADMPPEDSIENTSSDSPQTPLAEPYLAQPVFSAAKPVWLASTDPQLTRRSASARRSSWFLPLFLLAATCVSTFFAGSMSWEPHQFLAMYQSLDGDSAGMMVRQTILRNSGQGLIYMVCVVAILFAHEMGHYIATRIYRVPSSLPFFIPFPIAPIGTMGAVIAMKGQQANRREIFDIGIAGPLAGLVLAIPITWFGVAQMEPDMPIVGGGSYRYDIPLLVRWMYAALHPDAPMLTEVQPGQVNAMFMAGWVGLLITGLNMMPISQLDGGHVTYTLFGQYSRWIARVFIASAVAYMVFTDTYIWTVMLILVFLIGIYHPPTSNDRVPLGWGRAVLGLLSLLIPVLCFPPRGLMPF